MDIKTRFSINQHLDTLELKKKMHLLCSFNWRSKGVYDYKLKSVYTAFLHNIKLSGYRVRINL